MCPTLPPIPACIAHLKEIEPKPAKGQQPKTEAALKSQCEQQYKALQQTTLGFLISADWVIGQAEEQGDQAQRQAKSRRSSIELKKQQFPKEAEFQKFLASTGQTVSDLLLRVKLSMLTTKIQEKVTKEAKKNVNEAAVAKYYNEHKSQYGKPESRDLRIILTKTEAEAQQREEGNRIGQELRECRQEQVDRPDQQEHWRRNQRASSRARSRRRSAKLCLPPRRACSAAR